MSMSIPRARLTSTRVNVSITWAGLPSRAGKDKNRGKIGARFAIPRTYVFPARLTSTLVTLSITSAGLTSRAGED